MLEAEGYDDELAAVCADCGEPCYGELEGGYAFGVDEVLCRPCATRRGGRYDPEQEVWVERPYVADLMRGKP